MKTLSLLLLFFVLLAFVACSGGDERISGGGVTTENVVSAQVTLPNSEPAAGAEVTIRNAEFLPENVLPGYAELESSTLVDEDGSFRFENIFEGWYSIEIRLPGTDGLLIYRKDSLYLSGDSQASENLELEASVSVKIILNPVSYLRNSIYIGIPGTSDYRQSFPGDTLLFEGVKAGDLRFHLVEVRLIADVKVMLDDTVFVMDSAGDALNLTATPSLNALNAEFMSICRSMIGEQACEAVLPNLDACFGTMLTWNDQNVNYCMEQARLDAMN